MKYATPTAMIALLLSTSLAFAAGPDTDGDGVPNTAEPLLHTDPMNADTDGDGQTDLADDAPVFATDPITQKGSPATYRLGEVLVENNVDAASHKDAPDHLEIQVFNEGATDMTGYMVYYTFTDVDSGVVEAYFARPSVVIPAGGEAHIHFDEGSEKGHLRANPNSIYVTSLAAKHVSVSLQADGVQPVTALIEKDAGGAEAAD